MIITYLFLCRRWLFFISYSAGNHGSSERENTRDIPTSLLHASHSGNVKGGKHQLFGRFT